MVFKPERAAGLPGGNRAAGVTNTTRHAKRAHIGPSCGEQSGHGTKYYHGISLAIRSPHIFHA